MTKEEYQIYLQSDHWKYLRNSKLRQVGYKCQECDSSQSKLDVHHLKYKNIFDVTLGDLKVLCRACHYDTHNLTKDTKTRLKRVNKRIRKRKKYLARCKIRSIKPNN